MSKKATKKTPKSGSKKATPKKTSSKKNELIKVGDFVLIDFVGRVKDGNQIFDCSIEKIAQDENVHDEKEIYEPRLIIAGEGQLIKGLETRLIGLESGKTHNFKLSPDEGFGPRDAKQIRIENIRDFRKQNIKPQPGMRVRIGQRSGTVLRVGGGRVVVDYNSPLAGKELLYQLTIHRILVTEDDKLKGIIGRRATTGLAEQFAITKKATSIELEVPKVAFYAQQIQLAKAGVAVDIIKYFPKIKTIRFIETHERPAPESPKSSKKSSKPKAKAAKTKAKTKKTTNKKK